MVAREIFWPNARMNSRFFHAVHVATATCLVLSACGDDSSTTGTDSMTGTTETGTTAGPTSTTAGPTTDTTTNTTGPTGSESDSESDPSTTDPSTTDPSTTDPSTTDPSTTDPSTTDPSTTDPSTTDPTEGCICTPGEPEGVCVEADISVCAENCMEYEAVPCPLGSACIEGECVDNFCTPDTKICTDPDSYAVCNEEGTDFGDPIDCEPSEGCVSGNCISLCELAANEPSSIGCSFIGNRMDNFDDAMPDSLIVGNTYSDKTATVQFYFTPNNSNTEQAQGAPVEVPPGGTHLFTMTNTPPNTISVLRQGGSYRVESDIPIIAYQHSPIGQDFTNDASMLLPEHAMRSNHIVASYQASLGNHPSYFNVIALEDDTTVTWTPTANTLAGGGVPAVNAGQSGEVTMNRADTLQVRGANSTDLSGTFITGNGKPIWVVGAVTCVNVPAGVTFCDHIEEQLIPLDYWGTKYVGAHSPTRGSEDHHWRIFAGADNVTVTTDPVQPGTPFTLMNQGDFVDLVVPTNTSFIFESGPDEPFMPVQYLESQNSGAGTGDPSMYQMVPVEQFLNRYAFVTGTSYPLHYVQVIRPVGGSDVTIDGQTVNGFYQVGEFEVADHQIGEGGHLAESDTAFGIVGLGYSNATSYAYPGGLKLEVINPQ